MMSDIELETWRLIFGIDMEILTMELKEMIEKTIRIEKILRADMSKPETEANDDSYRPGKDIECPPKKKMKTQ